MKKELKNKKIAGITLIALVVTIIVLLILAGISISMLSGQNGILNRAATAKDKTDLESLKEEAGLILQNRKIEKETTGVNKKKLSEDLSNGISGVEAEEITKANGTDKYLDVCYISKNGKSITVYEDGEIQEGKVSIWKGATDIKCPEFKKDETTNIWNWYIYTAGQLKFLADFVNNGNSLNGTENGADLNEYVTQANYEPSTVTMSTDTTIYLMNNLDLGARPGEGTTEEEKWNTNPDELKWMPIGIDLNNVEGKLGTFEGNNYTICGVYVNRDAEFNGIFGNSNTIQNLTSVNSYFQGTNYIGGIAGVVWSGKIENCSNKNTIVNGRIYVGGIVGISLSNVDNVENCENNGMVIGGTKVGGIIGVINGETKILKCTNFNLVKGSLGDNIGGIVGGGSRNSRNNRLLKQRRNNWTK